uniref:Conjugal transfer protein TraG n=1 Tax=Toxocara canis TaxID=6265 RepID=A0A183VH86_TOXCA
LVKTFSVGTRNSKSSGAWSDESGIRTHASEETAALNQSLRPLGHLAKDIVGTRNSQSCVAWFDESGIRTHASEETGALNQRLRPLGHLAEETSELSLQRAHSRNGAWFDESGIRTHASEETGALNQRLRPLGHLAEETSELSLQRAHSRKTFLPWGREILDPVALGLTRVFFEPTPPQRLNPSTVATRNPKSSGAWFDESGIRTHASEETAALNQRLRPLRNLAEILSGPSQQRVH